MIAGLAPPSACPVGIGDLLRSWRSGGRGRDELASEQFCSTVCQRVRKRYGFAFNHARTAIAILLEELRQTRPDRDEVVVPAYTCYTVAASVAKVGLAMVVVDLDPNTLRYDWNALAASINERTLAVIVVHPFGMPCDVRSVKAITEKYQTFIIEDCAQAWDTKYKGKHLGADGDACVFSFGRGKHLHLGGGGICCVDDDSLASRLQLRVTTMPIAPWRKQIVHFLLTLLTTIGQHPSIYASAVRLPFLRIGETVFDPGFPVYQWSGWQARLGLCMLSKWSEMADARKRNAAFWREWFRNHPDYGCLPLETEGADIVYLRLPVLSNDREQKMQWFRQHGVHAQRMYPLSLDAISDSRLLIKSYAPGDGARYIMESLYTLPVHPMFNAHCWGTHLRSAGSVGR